jgi:hypothetical protein
MMKPGPDTMPLPNLLHARRPPLGYTPVTLKTLTKRDPQLDAYWGTNCPLVAMPGADGKIRPIRAADARASQSPLAGGQASES